MKKIIITFCLVLFTVAGLFIWGVVATYNYITQIKPTAVIEQNIQLVKNTAQQLPQLSLVSCLNKAQILFSSLQWIEMPLQQTLENLKSACITLPPPSWQDEENVGSKNTESETQKGVNK
jgi:hypothetical protein